MTRQYIGARYVPKFYEGTNGNNWDGSSFPYEALVIVTYLGNSYTSKKPVPIGIDITNTEYWVMSASYSSQIEALSERIDNLTVADVSDNCIIEPSDNPLGNGREQVLIRVPESVNRFVDNVLGIQNLSHGAVGSEANAYGNAAIAFFDGAQVERGAIGYSRENSIQPSGFVANTLYLEIGNPFGASGTDTDFRVIATNSSNFPSGLFYPFEHISATGKTTIKARGNSCVNLIGGVKIDNANSEYGDLFAGGLISTNRSGLAYNIVTGETGNKIDDTKNAYFFTVGEAYDIPTLDKTYEGFTFSISGAGSSNVYTLWNLDSNGKVYQGRYDYNSWAFNGISNISNHNLKTVPAMCLNNDSTNQPSEIMWNSGTSDSYIEFQYGDTISVSSLKGSIKYNSGTGQINYNTTSDYRVKRISGNADNSLDLIKQIKVYEGNICDSPEKSTFCIAHELKEILPYCVSGEKDAVDENGDFILQQVDYSKIVPVLIKAIQILAERSES